MTPANRVGCAEPGVRFAGPVAERGPREGGRARHPRRVLDGRGIEACGAPTAAGPLPRTPPRGAETLALFPGRSASPRTPAAAPGRYGYLPRVPARVATLRARIYAVVRRIPRGRVATYGQVARLARIGAHPRLVGYALAALPEDARVPWHRVLNAQGRVSPRSTPGWDALQRALLEREGIRFDERGRVDLARRRWQPGGR
jgi:methylated-DNA-protein-cysteine methyltransferase-like protein